MDYVVGSAGFKLIIGRGFEYECNYETILYTGNVRADTHALTHART